MAEGNKKIFSAGGLLKHILLIKIFIVDLIGNMSRQ